MGHGTLLFPLRRYTQKKNLGRLLSLCLSYLIATDLIATDLIAIRHGTQVGNEGTLGRFQSLQTILDIR